MTLGGFFEYAPGESWPHRLDARVKLAGLVLLSAGTVLLESPLLLALLWELALLFFVRARLPRAKVRLLFLAFPALFLALALAQGVFYAGPRGRELFCLLDERGAFFGRWLIPYLSDLAARWPGRLAFYAAGFRWGLIQALRCAALLTAGLAVALTTPPGRLLAALRRLGAPFELALVLSLTLRFLPLVLARLGESLAAQRTRGLDWKRLGWTRKLAAGWRVVRTVLFATLRGAREGALALDLRACRAPGLTPTLLDDLTMRRGDWLALAGLLLLAAGVAATAAAG